MVTEVPANMWDVEKCLVTVGRFSRMHWVSVLLHSLPGGFKFTQQVVG